jgi:transposase
MAKHSRIYPPEFRHQILELVRSGKTATVVAREFDLNRQTVINWMKQDERDGGRRSDGVTSAERDEISALRKKVRQLEIEREILKKAAAWFARETDAIPSKSSNS